MIVFFDIDGTIFNFSEAEFIKLWGDLAHKYFNRYLKRELTFDEQRRSRIKALYISTYLSFYRDSWKAFDDVISCLNELKDIQLGVISNGDYEHQIDKLTKVGLVDYFSAVITSGEVGYSKPDKRLFIEACKKLGETPTQCNYVGDDLSLDILGCNAAGLKGIWLNRKQEVTDQKNIVTINDLHALPNLLILKERKVNGEQTGHFR